MKKIILASLSPRRKELLYQVGVDFEIVPSEIDEENIGFSGAPENKAMELAYLKARDVAGKVESGLVLGADTIVVVDSSIFGKPLDNEDAYRMLSCLSGRKHQVITGIAVIDVESGFYRVSHETTDVMFTSLSPDEVHAYIKTGEPAGKAGAYAIQGIGALLVEKIDGCYSNVVGLPLMRLRRMMEEFGMKML